MRYDLSPSLIHQLEGRFVRPSFLVELRYGTQPEEIWRWSSGDTVEWDGKTWSQMGIRITGLTWESRISEKISLSIQNLDNLIGSIVLNTILADKDINVWILYQYDRNIFYSDIVNFSGSNTITIVEPIPSDLPQTGTIYIGAPGSYTGTGTTSYSFTSWNGRTFNISTPLTNTIPAGMGCYILKSGYNEDDAVKVFSGVIDDTDFNEKNVTMNLIPESTNTQFTPRRYINKSSGFNFLPQTGLKIKWGSDTFVLERAKY